ncbi:uncharacterized protein [Nicotiana sylvestris]|uniref:uncharacterized protein n=1 Tax=Nicotiana sylvestris TaxID=4096 RepID=UPI00388CCC88
MEGVNMLKRRQRGQQPQGDCENYDDGNGFSNECYDDQSEEVQYVNNYQGNRGNWNGNNNNNWNNNNGQGGWNNNGGQGNQGKGFQRPLMYQQPNNPSPFQSQGSSSSGNVLGRIENMFEQMMKKNQDSDAQLASHNTSIRNLEVQLGQISQSLNTRPKGSLPSDTVVNPKGGHNNHVMVETTRSGRGGDVHASRGNQVMVDEEELRDDDIPLVVEDVVEPNVNNDVRIEIDEVEEETQEAVNPSREHKFIEMMKSLIINVPLVEALEQMSGYAKFMKDLVTKKRSMECKTIKMTHQVSSILHSMAPKLEEHGAFTIPCTIESANFAKAVCDLEASINLMPYSVFKTLGIRQPCPTSMRLQMADRSMKQPLGIIDDVPVRVDKFILPTDFVILDCEVDFIVPIILGRPFLVMGKALVDVEAGELTFRVGDEKVVFHVCKSMRQPNSTEVCSFMDIVTAVIVDDTSAMINVEDPLEAVLLNMDVNDDVGRVECVNALHGMGSYSYEPRKLSLDLENRKTPPTKPSIEEPPVLELKPFPPHLRLTPPWWFYKSARGRLDGH